MELTRKQKTILSDPMKGPSPAQVLVVGFGAMILIGAVLLTLPAASADGKSIGFLDALFTATSGVCVTGLSVFDPGSTLSMFGQVTLLGLIQLGGIGFMTMTSIMYMLIGRRITLKDRVMIRESFNETRLQGMVRMTRNVVALTLSIEAVGMLLLATRFVPEFGIAQGWFYSLFQSVSSFCNAGFDVFGLGNNLESFVGDGLVNIVTMLLIILGGFGFFVVTELLGKATGRRKTKLSLHTRLVLLLTGCLIVAGFVIFLAAESGNPDTLKDAPPNEKVLGSLFQSVTSRTAGYSTIGQDDLLPISKVTTSVLMFIGAAPGGTAGGIKTTTTMVVVLFILSILRGREDVEVMKRRVNRNTVRRALATFTLGILIVFAFIAVISVIEHDSIEMRDVAFEVVSAFGTVGLSTGITASLMPVSKILIILMMLIGRVGILTFTLALAKRLAKPENNIRYPEERVIIG